MTYYELITLLESLITKNIIDAEISTINNAQCDLMYDRYTRFINEVGYVIFKRIQRTFQGILDKLELEYMDISSLTLELGSFKEEVNRCEALCNLNMVKDEDKVFLRKELHKESNEILSHLQKIFNDENRINLVENYKIKEN